MNTVPTPVNDLVQAAVAVLAFVVLTVGPFIIAKAIAFAHKAYDDFRTSQPEFVQKLIDTAAMFGATVAEKVGNDLKLYGQDKLDYALDAAKRWLMEQGFAINDETLRDAIHKVLFDNPDLFPAGNSADDSQG